MKGRIVPIIALAAIVHSLAGCTSYVNVSFDELNNQSVHQIDRIVYTTVIEGLTLRSGDEILFDKQGGLYDARNRVIRGVTETGENAKIQLDRVEQVLLKQGSEDGYRIERVNVWKFIRRSDLHPWRDHYDRSVQPGKSVGLRSSDAGFDPDKELFMGVTNRGKPIAVKPDEVFLQTRKFSVGKTALLTVLAAGVVVAIEILIELDQLSNWE